MDARYLDWLRISLPDRRSADTRLSHLRRVEACYGDIDALYEKDELRGLIEELNYTAEDKRYNRPNPSKIMIDKGADIYNNLSSYRAALRKYALFRQSVEGEAAPEPAAPTPADESGAAEMAQIFSLERDLQSSLRKSLSQLEPGLEIADGGQERSVPSGRIDILARDAEGRTVVIELKAVKAPRDAVAQVLAYMGDMLENSAVGVRGFLVAPEFDDKALAAAKMAPSLTLVTYRFNFAFEKRA